MYMCQYVFSYIYNITRYCSRPVITETRILKYENNNVTWSYTDHKHEEYHEITESAYSFITKLLRHLLPSNFKSIRSYGFYNKTSKLPADTNMIVSK